VKKPLYRLDENGAPKEGEKQDDGLTEPSLADFGGKVEIQVPADLTASQKEIAGGYAQDVGAIASEAGIPGEQANDLFAHILDLQHRPIAPSRETQLKEKLDTLRRHPGYFQKDHPAHKDVAAQAAAVLAQLYKD